MKIFLLTLAAIIIFSPESKAQDTINPGAQDSIRYGRYFAGIDPSPFTFRIFGLSVPDIVLQFKVVSLRNPCIRYRLVYNRFYREGRHLLYVREGYYPHSAEGYPANVKTVGHQQLNALGAGLEKVLPIGRVSFIAGSDVLVGVRRESAYSFFSDFSGPDSLKSDVYRQGYSAYVHTLFTGFAPFAGAEAELGERVSLQVSLRGVLGFNALLASKVHSINSMKTIRSKPEAHLTGINFILYYRF